MFSLPSLHRPGFLNKRSSCLKLMRTESLTVAEACKPADKGCTEWALKTQQMAQIGSMRMSDSAPCETGHAAPEKLVTHSHECQACKYKEWQS